MHYRYVHHDCPTIDDFEHHLYQSLHPIHIRMKHNDIHIRLDQSNVCDVITLI
jgi:hypothetical protein